MKTAHTNKGNRWNVIPGDLILIIVVMKFIAPKIDEIPAKWRLKIAKSIEPPEWKSIDANGGYTVHPVPAPPSTKLELNNKIKAGGKSQKLILFNLGNQVLIIFTYKNGLCLHLNLGVTRIVSEVLT